MPRNAGPTLGSANAPMIAAAGQDHVIFSKKLLGIVLAIFVVTGFVFFSIEQSRIAGNFAASRAALAQNNKIKHANSLLEQAKLELQGEEDELVSMYSKWLDEDSENLELSQTELNELKDKFKSMKDRIEKNSETLKGKEATLAEKEKRLQAYQYKIQTKQSLIDQMSGIIKTLNGTVPRGTQLGEDLPSDQDYHWDDYGGDGDSEYNYYDDDWLNDDEWY
eukprot:m.88546 g.88546  ORF g.88546 m.88546 type:complete len:221 (-) comp18075_c0_seq3:126-788(-)